MKIATWNIERLKHRKQLPEIIEAINKVDADILILTEADEAVRLPHYLWLLSTWRIDEPMYRPTEHRVTILTRDYKIEEPTETFDKYTAVCHTITTPLGPLAVYGTIIGTHGNRRQSFKDDLEKQIADIDAIVKQMPICIAGDFNISFSDNYYYTKHGRDLLTACFERNDLVNVTASLPECIDHIVLSKSFIGDREIKLTEFNVDKKLSDHKGVCVELINPRNAH